MKNKLVTDSSQLNVDVENLDQNLELYKKWGSVEIHKENYSINLIYKKIDVDFKADYIIPIDVKGFVQINTNEKKKVPKTSLIIICASVITASIVTMINPQPFGFIFAAPLLCPGYMHGKKIIQWIKDEIKK